MHTLETIESTLRSESAVALYFSAPSCNVCHALKPKLFSAIEANFPRFHVISVDISETPEIASHYSVFAIPTLLIFLDGREFLRKSRNMSVEGVIEEIRRPYEIMTS
jgi:thioredoxin 1